jgi:hypothetical protein
MVIACFTLDPGVAASGGRPSAVCAPSQATSSASPQASQMICLAVDACNSSDTPIANTSQLH